MKQEISAMRVAGIVCAVALAIIAYFSFSLPNNEFIDYVTQIGQFLGGGTTYGVLALAAIPPTLGFLCYFIWKWAKK